MLSALQKKFPEITDIIRNKGYKIQDKEYLPTITVYLTSSFKTKEHTWNYQITLTLSGNSIPYDIEDQKKIIKELLGMIKEERKNTMNFLKHLQEKNLLLMKKSSGLLMILLSSRMNTASTDLETKHILL